MNCIRPSINYNNLNTESLINLVVDFIKVGQELPEEIKQRLIEQDLYTVLYPNGDKHEEQDY